MTNLKLGKGLLILFLVLHVNPGCNTGINGNSHSVSVKKQASEKLDDYISKIEIVPLETNERSIIKYIRKVDNYRDELFVQNGRVNIHVFSNTGKYKRSIGHLGRGPGEISYIADFQINRFTGNIEILEPRGTVKIFSTDGEFLGYYSSPCQEVSYFYILDEDKVLFFHNYCNPALNIYSRSGDRIEAEYFEFPENYFSGHPINGDVPYYVFGKELFIHSSYENKVYRFKNGKPELDYEIDFGKNRFETAEYHWDPGLPQALVMDNFKEREFAYCFHSDFETPEHIYKHFYYGNDQKLLVIDKHRKDYRILTTYKDLNKFHFTEREKYTDFLLNEIPDATSSGTRVSMILNYISGDDHIVCSYSPTDIRLGVNKNILDEENLSRYNNIGPMDNPVLVKIWFR